MISKMNTVFVFNGYYPTLDVSFIQKMVDLNLTEVVEIPHNYEDPVAFAQDHLYAKDNNEVVGQFVVCTSNLEIFARAFPNNILELSREKLTSEDEQRKFMLQLNWILSNCGMDKEIPDDVFFTSDSHFGHGNIIKYCNRPWKSGQKDGNGELIISESDVFRMNEDLIARWNSVVKPENVVWHLGDFALGDKKRIPEIVSRLNGKINLVLGNHDHAKMSFYQDAGFHRVYDRSVVLSQFVILSHAPMTFVKAPFFNVFGHVHDNEMYRTFSKDGCCVCVERHDYKPISWKYIKEQVLRIGKGND